MKTFQHFSFGFKENRFLYMAGGEVPSLPEKVDDPLKERKQKIVNEVRGIFNYITIPIEPTKENPDGDFNLKDLSDMPEFTGYGEGGFGVIIDGKEIIFDGITGNIGKDFKGCSLNIALLYRL